MSSGADDDAATIVAAFNAFYTNSYCELAAEVLFIYETITTLDREVVCFWSTKRRGSSVLFFANKWLSMILYVMGLIYLAIHASDKRSVSAFLINTQVLVQCTAFINPDLLTPSDDDVEMEVVGLDREDGREGGAQTCETEAAASSSFA